MDFDTLKYKVQELVRHITGKKDEDEEDADRAEEKRGVKAFFSRVMDKLRGKKEEDDTDTGETNAKGEHKQSTIINRKFIGFAIIGMVLVSLLSYSYFDDSAEKGAQLQKHAQQQAANEPANKDNKVSNDPSYKDLAAINQKNQQRAGAANAQNQNGNQERMQAVRQQSAPPSAPVVIRPASAPTASVPSVSAPRAAALPPVNVSMPAQQSGKNAEKGEADKLEQRYSSAIDFALGKGAATSQAPTASAVAAPVADAALPNADVSPQGTNANMLQVASFSSSSTSPYVVQAGTLIPAMLFSGINTDTPGQVIAQTSADVYDSLTQTNLLIPAGSRLIGTYESGKTVGSGRINVVFSTVIFPSGEAFDIGSSIVAVDGGGYNGLVGKVHRHTGRMLGAGMFSSAIAALGSLASGNTNSTDTYSGGQLAMQGALANLIQSTANLFGKGSDVQPTVTIEPGHTFQLFVAQPISFGTSM